MKKYFLVFLIKLIFIFNSFASDKIDAYSFFYEEDGEGALILYYQNNDIYGQVIAYGGYKWFKATYSNKDTETSTFIQPSYLGKSMDQDSWMQPRYQIDEIVYEFLTKNESKVKADLLWNPTKSFDKPRQPRTNQGGAVECRREATATKKKQGGAMECRSCLLYTSPSPRD